MKKCRLSDLNELAVRRVLVVRRLKCAIKKRRKSCAFFLPDTRNFVAAIRCAARLLDAPLDGYFLDFHPAIGLQALDQRRKLFVGADH